MTRGDHDDRQHPRSKPPATILVVLSVGPKTPAEIEDALALTILKSCADLTRDLIRSHRGGQQPELSRYSLWIADRLDRMIRTRIETWLLYLIGAENLTARADLLRRAAAAADPDVNPLLREYGMEADARAMIEPAIDQLTQRGLLLGTEPLAITDAGRRQLQHALRRRF